MCASRRPRSRPSNARPFAPPERVCESVSTCPPTRRNRRKIGRVECSDIDVGAARFKQCAAPLWPNSGDQLLQLGALDDARFDARRQFGQLSREMWRSPRDAEEAMLAKVFWRVREERPRRERELGDFVTAVAFQIESRRAAGRMIAALVLCFDDQRPPLACNLGAQARAGDPAADDDDVEVRHLIGRLRIRKPRRLVVTSCSTRRLPTCCSWRSPRSSSSRR